MTKKAQTEQQKQDNARWKGEQDAVKGRPRKCPEGMSVTDYNDGYKMGLAILRLNL